MVNNGFEARILCMLISKICRSKNNYQIHDNNFNERKWVQNINEYDISSVYNVWSLHWR